MRRVWAAVLAVWSTLAIVAVLAWTHPPARPYAMQQHGTPAVIMVRGKNGAQHLAHVVILPAGTSALTTSGPSGVATGGSAPQLISAQPQAVTHSS